ncbi:hypothetical protein EK21DRAFT_35174, partial [Setomelanomma holmii]
TIVCKPQVSFTERLKDYELHRLTVSQLRKKARNQGLDTSRLTKKWEFVHILVEHRDHIAQPYAEHVTDTQRRTVFDLPGEIRNRIYGYVLAQSAPIVARYDSAAERDRVRKVRARLLPWNNTLLPARVPVPKAVKQLRSMSWANRELRQEAGSYFFAHNCFRVEGSYSNSYAKFLSDIGHDGCAAIGELHLDTVRFWMYNAHFYHLLGACENLRKLRIFMHLGHILTASSYDLVRDLLIG